MSSCGIGRIFLGTIRVALVAEPTRQLQKRLGMETRWLRKNGVAIRLGKRGEALGKPTQRSGFETDQE
jgi:hypothetical protein